MISNETDTTNNTRCMDQLLALPWVPLDLSLCFLISLPNIISIILIMKIGNNRLQSTTASNRFLICLAVADLLVGLTLPYRSALTLYPSLIDTKFACVCKFVLLILGCSGSVVSLTLVAADRYIGIIHALRYPNIVTDRRSYIACALAWILALLYGSMLLYWNIWKSPYPKSCTLACVAPKVYVVGILGGEYMLLLCTMLLVYIKIQAVAREQIKHFAALHDLAARDRIRAHLRSLHTVVLILGCFVCAWMPYLTISSIQAFQITSNEGLNLAYEVTTYMGVSNSGLNPFLYVWKNRDLRQQLKRMIHDWRRGLRTSLKDMCGIQDFDNKCNKLNDDVVTNNGSDNQAFSLKSIS